MQQFLSEYGGQTVWAIIVVTIMFIGMRVNYGCWPWEREKTWHETRHRLKALITSRTSLLDTESAFSNEELDAIKKAWDKKVMSSPPSNDSFVRDDEKITPLPPTAT